MAKLIFEGLNYKKKIIEGMKKAASIITTTYGGQGGVVMYQPLNGPATFTKDGFEVSKQIQFEDLLDNVGGKFVQDACDKIAFKIGDGTTTMAAILSRFIEEAFKYELAGVFPRDINIGLNYGIEKTLEILNTIPKKIKKDDYESIRSIALVSSNYDKQVASFIEEAYTSINKYIHHNHPIILIEESKTEESTVNIVEGMQLQRGIFSPQFFKKDEKNKMKIEFNNHPYVIVFGKTIGRGEIQFLLPILDEIIKKGKSCLLVASDFSEDAITFFLVNRHNGMSDIVCVKTPGFGDSQLAIAEDIAIRTGGVVIGANNDILLEDLKLNDIVGSAEKICIERDLTIIVGGKGKPEEIQSRCELLNRELKFHSDKGSSYHVEQVSLRIQSLTGVICIIKLGGLSEMKITEMKHRVEDANHATKHALLSGIVPGGGIDLLYASEKLKEYLNKHISTLNKNEKLGLEIMINSLKEPFYKLVKSCGLSSGVSEEKVIKKFNETGKLQYGIDVRSGQLVNFIEIGVLNPAAISFGILNVLKEMISLFVMCDVFIIENPNEDKNLHPGMNSLNLK
jgi:chaperonin GroEL